MANRKIFAIGLPRCGTSSLHNLFTTLGLKSQHLNGGMLRNIGYGIFNYGPIKKYDAFSDSPFPYLWKDLFYLYPKAQFILNTRSEDAWVKSIELLWKMNTGKRGNWRDEEKNVPYRNYLMMLYGTVDFEENALRVAFRRHHSEIRNFFKNRNAEKFLEINIEDDDQANAEKIAAFLGMPLPEGTEMPMLNIAGVDLYGKFEEILPVAQPVQAR